MEFSTSSVVTGSQQSGRETPVCGPHTVTFLQKQLFLTPNEISYIGLLSPKRTRSKGKARGKKNHSAN